MPKPKLRVFITLVVQSLDNPANGRLINRDPIAEAGGNNLYAFVGNDPVNFTDHLGLIFSFLRNLVTKGSDISDGIGISATEGEGLFEVGYRKASDGNRTIHVQSFSNGQSLVYEYRQSGNKINQNVVFAGSTKGLKEDLEAFERAQETNAFLNEFAGADFDAINQDYSYAQARGGEGSIRIGNHNLSIRSNSPLADIERAIGSPRNPTLPNRGLTPENMRGNGTAQSYKDIINFEPGNRTKDVIRGVTAITAGGLGTAGSLMTGGPTTPWGALGLSTSIITLEYGLIQTGHGLFGDGSDSLPFILDVPITPIDAIIQSTETKIDDAASGAYRGYELMGDTLKVLAP